MKVRELALAIGAGMPVAGKNPDAEIEKICAGDRVSELLNGASAGTLIVTGLSGPQLVRLAGLMDAPAICLVGGAGPDREAIIAAERNGTTILKSPFDMFETCGRIYVCLRSGRMPPGIVEAKDP
ncbi:MAG: hypothetical protein N3A38_03290 [Planctomycetota bacterium]|nr:hypothetical protein [Planctomycetota bacterium]